MFDLSSHYSTLSIAFYVILGCTGALCISCAKIKEYKTGREATLQNKFLFLWWFIWVFFAVFRFVGLDCGGTDAPTYIDYFRNCNGATVKSWYQHANGDFLFKWLTKIIRFFTSEYRIYFLALYGFMAYAYIKFTKTFTSPKTNFAPFILCFFLFLRSYNTIRSNLAIAFIALGCTFIIEKKWKTAYLLGLSAVLIHKSAIIYAPGIPFCHFFINRKITVKTAILLILGTSLIGRFLQDIFIQYTYSTELNGAYASYARRSIGKSFFENAWKIAFEQIALGIMMLLMRKKIGINHDNQTQWKLKIIWTLCIFDLILIPINFIIGSWRGYEFFYLARIIMWGECLYQLTAKTSPRTKVIYNILLSIAFIAWMVFRINHTWEDSKLLPYIFEPFMWIL